MGTNTLASWLFLYRFLGCWLRRSKEELTQLPAVCVALILLMAVWSSACSAAGWVNVKKEDVISIHCPRRNAIFYVGEPIQFSVGQGCKRYEVRDYWGDIVDRGKYIGAMKKQPPGWYKVYLYGQDETMQGGATFVVFRRSDNFPVADDPQLVGGAHPAEDEVVRGITGMVPNDSWAEQRILLTFLNAWTLI